MLGTLGSSFWLVSIKGDGHDFFRRAVAPVASPGKLDLASVTECSTLVDEYVRVGNAEDAALLGSRDPNHFGRFYERHVDGGRLVSRPAGPGADVVFDLTAETFARAFERRGQYDPARGPAVAWVLVIARNLLIDSLRHARVVDESRVRLGVEAVAIDDAQEGIRTSVCARECSARRAQKRDTPQQSHQRRCDQGRRGRAALVRASLRHTSEPKFADLSKTESHGGSRDPGMARSRDDLRSEQRFEASLAAGQAPQSKRPWPLRASLVDTWRLKKPQRRAVT